LENGTLPFDDARAWKIAVQESLFAIVDGTLYFIDNKRESHKRIAVPAYLKDQVLVENRQLSDGRAFFG